MTDLDDATPQVGELTPSELTNRIELIGALSLAQRASGFLQLHDELVTELERSDQQPADATKSGGPHA
ncbi:hypothetical protein JOF28_001174 [Leucobacter exalbidus]|uniref:Uncharacterized protein n=1 Tax=Leucobacter exalbidus TaxID=662960 RepID=A0A940PL52_9MICO|nr:hypothetical protein [Leucobacter exalbidus]MBP1325942.1 hypothetical protein [Leucobacter exalbidus]